MGRHLGQFTSAEEGSPEGCEGGEPTPGRGHMVSPRHATALPEANLPQPGRDAENVNADMTDELVFSSAWLRDVPKNHMPQGGKHRDVSEGIGQRSREGTRRWDKTQRVDRVRAFQRCREPAALLREKGRPG